MATHSTGDGGIPPRDAAQRGLKRVMTLGGAYGTRNYTVKDLRDLKGKRVLTETLPFTPEEAAAAEEAAGAWAVEVEVIPAELLAEISRRTTLLTSSIGAGGGGDIQFLFAEDILGNNGPPYPRHSKQYRNFFKIKQEMQAERVAGFKEFIADVRAGGFPAAQHVVKSPPGVIELFVKQVDNKGQALSA